YGSYFRAGDPLGEFEAVLETARALGAPRIRIWAGRTGSAEASAAQRAAVAEGARVAAELAGDIEVALEFHGGTLTDEPASAVALAMSGPAFARLFTERSVARLGDVADVVDADIGALGDVELLLTGWGCPPVDEVVLAAAPRLRAIVHAAGSAKRHVAPACW